jgi:hypothetical protein
MRFAIIAATSLIALVACLPELDLDPKPGPGPVTEPEPEPEPGPQTTVIVPMYSYDEWDIPAVEGEVGNTIVLDVSDLAYDRQKEYSWIAWTGEDKGSTSWNVPALGTTGLLEAQMEFEALFPGYYHIAWCPTDSKFECLFWGDIEITGEVPFNTIPDVDFSYSEPDRVSLLCAEGCQYVFETDHEYVFSTEISDDDEQHSYFMYTRPLGDQDYETWRNDLNEDELTFTPSKQGKYRVNFKTYDGHVTVSGPQYSESTWTFSVRDANNSLPETSFVLEGYPHVTASMSFGFDEDERVYAPVIHYYYEQTITNDVCGVLDRCEARHIDFDTYQNNRGSEDIPVFKIGDKVRFNAANSSDPDGEALSYLWSGYIRGDINSYFMEVGDNKATYEPATEKAGDYFVSLCLQETGYNSIYNGVDYNPFPLFWPVSQMCPQIQFRVEE